MKTVLHAVSVVSLCLLIPAHSLASSGSSPLSGARTLSPLPPAGVHPRVLFTAADLPDIKHLLMETENGRSVVWPKMLGEARGVLKHDAEFAALDLSAPDPATLEKYWRNDEGRNHKWGIASMVAVLEDDAELKRHMIDVICNYGRLILAAKEMGTGDVVGKTGANELNKRFNVWKSKSFDLSVCWLFGGAGYALSYDLLYNDMTDEERAIVRAALAAATEGRRSHGMGEPRGRAISNHYGYHGDLAVMLAAIEGEEGFDEKTWEGIRQVLVDHWEIGVTPGGYYHEDGYFHLGFREGSRGLLVLARRGYNVFETPKYRKWAESLAQDLEPFENGSMIGGASGGPDSWKYPDFAIIMKYMLPDDPVVDYVYRWTVGTNYRKNHRGLFSHAFFCSDYNSDPSKPNTLAGTGLELTKFYPRRGKLITRSDWSPDAAYLIFDARPDAFTIGHDKVDRGNFIFSALGRSFATHGSFHNHRNSTDQSLVHIDGMAQGYKAPSVNFLAWKDDGQKVSAQADLKYAYDWQWSPPWPDANKTFPDPWEHETSDPRDLGWPDDPDWLPHTLYGTPEIGYQGSWMWRRPYNPVERAYRTVHLVRGKQPYALIEDDIKKDDQAHRYEWYMHIANDLVIVSQSGRSIVLGRADDEPSDPQLLVQIVQARDVTGETPDELDVKQENYTVAVDKYKKVIAGNRLIIGVDSVEPRFRIALIPLRKGETLPEELQL
ncbi:MAG: hypothetical protein ACO398_10805 [Kiritimatiellia bacterium]